MNPPNDDFVVLMSQLRANSRVDLYDKNYLIRLKWIFPFFLLMAFISLSILFYFGLVNQTQLIISSLFVIAVLVFVQLIARRSRIAVLKGDTLILKGINVKSTVTLIRSVKKVSSFHFFGVQVTRLNYILDNQKKSSLILGAPSGMKTSLAQLIKHVKKQEKNKRQIISRVL